MTRRPFGSVNCSNAMRPACAPSTPGMVMSNNTNSLRMDSGLRGEERKSVGFEDGPLLLVRERQGQELIDVLTEVFHSRTGPVGTPQHAVHNLREAGKRIPPLGGWHDPEVEPLISLTTQVKETFLLLSG